MPKADAYLLQNSITEVLYLLSGVIFTFTCHSDSVCESQGARMDEFERIRKALKKEERPGFDALRRQIDLVAENKPRESRAAFASRGPDGNIPLPEGDEDLLELVKATEVEAICLAQSVPSDPGATSFVGGLPIVSTKFAWPRSVGPSGYAPHSFIAQIDCATLPAFDGRQLLPGDGRLCFFVDWEIFETGKKRQSENSGLVAYDQGAIAKEMQAPGDLPQLFGDFAHHRFPWLKAVGEYPKTFSKWQLTAHAIRTYADESYVRPDEASDTRYRAVRDALRTKQMLALFGEDIERPRYDKTLRELAPPTGLFPEYWLQMQAFFGGYAEVLDTTTKRGIRRLSAWPADVDELSQAYKQLHAEVCGLLSEARERRAFSPVPPKLREAFIDWCRTKTAQIEPVREAQTMDLRSPYKFNEMMRISHVRTAAEIVSRLGTEGILYDTATIDMVRSLRSSRHQVLGHANSPHAAARRLGKNKVLLAEFSSESGAWQWGDMNHLQYWIELNDLKARRFDRVEVDIA
ncbi:DUF1963 domain-containing protein [Devosia riboflavina]